MSNPQAAQRRPAVDLEGALAVVLDTNAFAYGQFSASGLRTAARRLAAASIDVWIAETVLWEWTEHAATSLALSRSELTHLSASGIKVEIPEIRSKFEIETLLRNTIIACGPNVKILSVSTVASNALRDQVLLAGPAEAIKTKTEGHLIKTGASDSAMLRAALEQVEGDESKFIVISKDTDIAKAFKDWGKTKSRVVKNLQPVLDSLPARVATAQIGENSAQKAKRLVREHKFARFCLEFLALNADELEIGLLQGELLSELEDGRSELANEDCFAEEGRQLVGLEDFDYDEAGETAWGVAYFLASVTASGIVQSESGDSLVGRDTSALGALIEIPVTFTIAEGLPVAVEVDSGAGTAARPSTDEYVDEAVALDDLMFALYTHPDIVQDEGWEFADARLPLVTAPGSEYSLEYERNSDRWTVTLMTGSRVVGEVACHNLHDGLSDGEGETWPNRWRLTTTVDIGFAQINPLWGLNVALSPPPELDYLAIRSEH